MTWGTRSEQATLVRAAIEEQLDNLRRGVELLVWRKGLADSREAIAEVAADILQETVVRALVGAEKYDASRASAHAWLMGIAINVVRENGRQARRDLAQVPLDSATTGATSDDLSPDQLTGLSDLLGEAGQTELLTLVTPAEAILLWYRFVDDLTPEEIGKRLGITAGAVRVRVSRARKHLIAAYKENLDRGEWG